MALPYSILRRRLLTTGGWLLLLLFFSGQLRAQVANDNCAAAAPLAVAANCTAPVMGSVLGATESLAPTGACGFGNNAYDVWYSFVASGATQTLTLNAQFAAVLDLRSGNCASSTSIFCTTVAAQGVLAGGLVAGQTYFIRVYPNGGMVPRPTNSAFTLCVTPGPAVPPNDNCAGAVPVAVQPACAVFTTGTVAAATQSLPPTAQCGNVPTARDVWYSFVANGPTQTVSLSSNFSAVLEVLSGSCGSTNSIFCTANSAAQGVTVGGLTPGSTYFIRVYPNNPTPPAPGAASTFRLCVANGPVPAPNDNCATATPLPVTTTCAAPVSGTVVGASQSLPPTPGCGFSNQANDVWFSFVAAGTSHLLTLVSRFQPIMEVREGSCASSTSVACLNGGFNGQPQLVSGLTSGQTYFVRIYPAGGIAPAPANATFTLCLQPGPTAPVNDECAGAIAVPVTADCTAPTTASLAVASQSLPPVAGCGAGGLASDVWFSFVAADVNQYITLGQLQFGAVVDVRIGTCASSLSVFCAVVNPGQPRPVVATGLFPGQPYFLRVYTPQNVPVGAAAFTVCITNAPAVPANDECAGALNVPVQPGIACTSSVSADNTSATDSGSPLPQCASYQDGDLWFKVTVPASGVVNVRTVVPSTGGGVNDTGMSVYSGVCGNLTELGCDDDSGGNLKSYIPVSGRTPGEVLYVRVWAYGGNGSGLIAVCATDPTLTPTRAKANTEALLVYPNPSSTGQLTLRLAAAHPAGQLTLLNALGQQVRAQALPAGTAELQLSTRGLAAGVYTLQVAVANEVLTRKVVLE